MNIWHIIFHDDIDGIFSAACVLKAKVTDGSIYRLYPISSSNRGKDFNELIKQIPQDEENKIAVVDFERHPRADLWIDHHHDQSMGPNKVFTDKIMYDPSRQSAAGIAFDCLVRHDIMDLDTVHGYMLWVDIIDSASYTSVESLFNSTNPVMILRAYLERIVPNDMVYCRIVESIVLHDFDVRLAIFSMKIDERYVNMIREEVRSIKKDLVVADNMSILRQTTRHEFPRYAEYYVRRDIMYAVRFTKLNSDSWKFQIGFNKWCGKQNKIDLGAVLRGITYMPGAGGHYNVGGGVVREDKIEELLDELCVTLTAGGSMEKYGVDASDPVEARAQELIKTGAEKNQSKARAQAIDDKKGKMNDERGEAA